MIREKGTEPQALLPRPGGQVHLGRRSGRATSSPTSWRRSSPRSSRHASGSRSARRRIWQRYERGARATGRPSTACGCRSCPSTASSAYHMFYVLLPSLDARTRLIEHLRERGILAVFHYLPLHLSAMGRRYGGREGQCPVTEDVSDRLLRLPVLHRADRGGAGGGDRDDSWLRRSDALRRGALRALAAVEPEQLLVPRPQPADRLDAAAALPRCREPARARLRHRLRARRRCGRPSRAAARRHRALRGGAGYARAAASRASSCSGSTRATLPFERRSSTSWARSTCSSTWRRTRRVLGADAPGGPCRRDRRARAAASAALERDGRRSPTTCAATRAASSWRRCARAGFERRARDARS